MLRTCLRRHVNLQHCRWAHLTFHRSLHASPPRRLFGISLPEPSNEPLAGTGTVGGNGVPWLFILEVFLGLPTALWLYKCLMLVAFQRKIIYLPSVPPGTRSESLSDEERTSDRNSSLSGMEWREVTIESGAPSRILRQKVALKGIEVTWGRERGQKGAREDSLAKPLDKVVVIYCQGNAGTPLLRIPLFRQLLKPDISRTLHQSGTSGDPRDLTILAVAPRSFWRSTRSTPTESSVLADYRAAIEYARTQHGESARYVLYGHSLGGAASVLLVETAPIDGLILENPLPSIPYMVKALYPQKWLPYHYLGFAAFDRWDALGVLRRRRRSQSRILETEMDGEAARTKSIPSLWIRSGRDEIIPTGEQDGVRAMFEDWTYAVEGNVGDDGDPGRAKWVTIEGALHDTAFLERRWREEIRAFLRRIAGSEMKPGGTCVKR